MISTTVETDNAELEIKPALEIIGDVLEMFVQVSPVYIPMDDGKKSNVLSNYLTYGIFLVVCHKEL